MDKNKSTSWGWIIFWLIVFWPVGLYLIIKKYSTDRQAAVSGNTGSLNIIAWILIVMGGLMVISSFSTESVISSILMGLFVLAGGIVLLRKAKQNKLRSETYKKYIQIVVNSGETSIDSIASVQGVTSDNVVKNLQEMIDLGLLNGAYINQANRQIVLPNQQSVVQNQKSNGSSSKKIITCPGCGAKNVISGNGVQNCEYCGTPLV